MTRRITSLFVIIMALIVMGVAAPAQAQTVNFTFGGPNNETLITSNFVKGQSPHPVSGCERGRTWNGVDYDNPPYGNGNPGSGDNGGLCFNDGINGMDIPELLGFPNGGNLRQCTQTYQSPVGAWQNVGDTFTIDGTMSGCYDGGNTTVTFTQNYVITKIVTSCRYRCSTLIYYQLSGGSGVATNPQ